MRIESSLILQCGIALILMSACSDQLPEDAVIWQCDSVADCGAGHICHNGYCTPSGALGDVLPAPDSGPDISETDAVQDVPSDAETSDGDTLGPDSELDVPIVPDGSDVADPDIVSDADADLEVEIPDADIASSDLSPCFGKSWDDPNTKNTVEALSVGEGCGLGACAGGTVNCVGISLQCSTQGLADLDNCDGVDNDCDGITDGPYISGPLAAFPFADADPEGSSPKYKGDDCGEHWEGCGGGVVCEPATDGVVNGLICSTDGDVLGGSACGLGVCASTGVTSCLGGWFLDTCVPGAGSGVDDDCDGQDDDCDGATDEEGGDSCDGACVAVLGVSCDEVEEGFLEGAETDNFFGAAVAFAENTLVIGVPQHNGLGSGVISAIDAELVDGEGWESVGSGTGAKDSGAVFIFDWSGDSWEFQAFLKGPSSSAGDKFGSAVAIDGDTVAVGAVGTDDIGPNTGSVFIFTREGEGWTAADPVMASDASDHQGFGGSVAFDGIRLAVGTDQVGGLAAVYIFEKPEAVWVQTKRIVPDIEATGSSFGAAIALSGGYLAVGAPTEGSDATTIDGDADNTGAPQSGAVYIFAHNGGAWTQDAYFKAFDASPDDEFGTAVALSGWGLAVGAPHHSVGGYAAGAAYVFLRGGTGVGWSEYGIVTASNGAAGALFGTSVALYNQRLLVGAPAEFSDAKGISLDAPGPAPTASAESGAAYLFQVVGEAWSQTAYFKAFNAQIWDRFGSALVMGDDRLVVGAPSRPAVYSYKMGSE